MKIACAVALAAAAAAIGCGGGSDATGGAKVEPAAPLEDVTMSLEGHASAEDVGVLMADKLGFFREEGLRVAVDDPLVPTRPMEYVPNGIVQFALSQQPELVLSRAEQVPVVAVGSLLPEATASFAWLEEAGIDDVADLEGKTIGISGLSYERAFLEAILRQAGLKIGDVEVKRSGYRMVPELLGGEVDAIFGGSSNVEGVRLADGGPEVVFTPVGDLGVPPYEEVAIVTRPELVATEPELVRKFVSAVVRGARAAIEDPAAAAEAIHDQAVHDRAPAISQEEAEAQLEATLPLLSESGYMDPGQADRLGAWMQREGMIGNERVARRALTNAFLPQP
ncbi:MAG TPA: ABC transporter substrate-binding protein [Solirubrobacterales bacterium]|nr:ABC transporter substrate-binding protein [Solirubrobacterales bacterium]